MGEEKIVQQSIFLPRAYAMHQSRVTKANYESFSVRHGWWLVKSSKRIRKEDVLPLGRVRDK